MKTCPTCGRPGVRYPLTLKCHWCLEGEMGRTVEEAIGLQARITGITVTPFGYGGAKEGGRVVSISIGGKIVLGARP